jgi:hypothetical protein
LRHIDWIDSSEQAKANLRKKVEEGLFFRSFDGWSEKIKFSEYIIKEKVPNTNPSIEIFLAEHPNFPNTIYVMKFLKLENSVQQNLPLYLDVETEKKIHFSLSILSSRSIFCHLEKAKLDLQKKRISLIYEHGAINLWEATELRNSKNNNFTESELASTC